MYAFTNCHIILVQCTYIFHNKMYFSNHVFFKRRRLRAKVKTVLNRYSTSMSLATKIKNFSRGYREL